MTTQETIIQTCIINNAYCVPGPCANCKRVFCAHEHPERRAFGYYGQYCTETCREAKCQHILALGRERFQHSRVVLIVEPGYCYLVLDRDKSEQHRGYSFRVLHEANQYNEETLALDYCHYPGFAMEEHPLTYALRPKLQIVVSVWDDYGKSNWTTLGFRLLDGEIDTYGVGGHIEVIDLRPNQAHAEQVLDQHQARLESEREG